MTTFTELLPERKASKHSTINWRPTPGDFSPVAGVLTIHTDRASVAYTVTEFPTGWTGRGFTLTKVTEGTDPETESYSVYCRPACPTATCCTCRGHERWLTCKHADSINALVANGWL